MFKSCCSPAIRRVASPEFGNDRVVLQYVTLSSHHPYQLSQPKVFSGENNNNKSFLIGKIQEEESLEGNNDTGESGVLVTKALHRNFPCASGECWEVRSWSWS